MKALKSIFQPLLAACCLLLPATSRAATHVWSGNGSNDLFTTAANWSSGGVPAAGEPGLILLVFPAGSGSPTPLDNIAGLAVDGITFAGGGYNLRGSGGVTLTLRRAAVGAFSILCTASAGIASKIEASLPLVLASTTRVQTDFVLNLDSAISGIGGLKCEGGAIHLRGTQPNTYAFTTTVTAGNLYLEKSNGVNSIGGNLVIDGALGWGAADHQMGATSLLTIQNNGYFYPGAAETLPAVHFDHGRLVLPSGPGVVFSGDITVGPDGDNYISGYGGLEAAARNFNIDAGAIMCLDGTLANGGVPASGITKLGTGILCLRAANTFTGNVIITQGDCLIAHPNALGTGGGTTTISAGATLSPGGSTMTIASETLNLAGRVFTLEDTIWTGPVVLSGTDSTFEGAFSGVTGDPFRFIHTGVMSGSGQLTKGVGGGLVLQGDAGNTYSGGTVVYGELILGKTAGNAIPGTLEINLPGRVLLAGSNQTASTAAVTINGGLLDMGARTNTIGLLSGTGGEITFALGTLSTGGAGSSTWSGLLSGNGATSLIKQGGGTLTLTNSANGGDTLTGAIAVNDGTLQMDGLHPGPITVNSAGLLSGSGTVGTVNVQGGKVCLCALKTGILSINGAGSQAVTAITFGSYGHIVSSQVNLTQSSLNASLSFVPYAGSSFMLIENTGPLGITGTFSGLPEGSPVIFGTQIFNITYHGGSGNDVVLTLVSGGRPPFTIDKFTSSAVPGNPGANAVLIEATGQPGVKHVIESSNDLQWWEVIDEIPVTSDAQGHSSTSFFDDNPDRRFYRVREIAL